MHYVLDTGFFIASRDYYPDIFTSFWSKMDEATKLDIISSVDEVKKELEQYGGEQQHLMNWVNSHSNIFTKPDEKEQRHIRKIFEDGHAQGLIGKVKMLRGGPFADPFVIAKAMLVPQKMTVVTRELPAKKDKNNNMQGAPKMPDVCNTLGVACITPEDFMQKEGWKF